jgi:putative DNA primase/helicase
VDAGEGGSLAVSPEELDKDPMLFNVENGTRDLKTGALRPHRPEDLITKLAPVEFDVTAESPTFDKFLKQILVDKELIAFVQRYLGYSLTGLTKERTMAVLHGVGKNGKSTLVELFIDLLGDYSATADPNTLMQQRYNDATSHCQLAELTGVRFVGMSETKRDVKLEESVVKQVTGNDTVSARAPFGWPFSYRPQFKIWLSTNHKPEIPDGSEAIWDRLRLIPFTQRFEGKRADADLPDKLREELPGILAWAVMGCVEWYQHGLGSAAVDSATSAYRTATDPLERFLQEVCVFGEGLQVERPALHKAYEEWCINEDEEPKGSKTFTQLMTDKGVVKNFYPDRSNGKRIWRGVTMGGSEGQSDTSDPSVTAQKPCKQIPGEGVGVTLRGESENFSPDVPRGERFSENGSEVSLSSPSVTDAFTTPHS